MRHLLLSSRAAVVGLLLVSAGLLVVGTGADAQSGSTTLITIALPDEFPHSLLPEDGAPAVIGALILDPGNTEIIVLNPEFLSPGNTARAVESLRRSRTNSAVGTRRAIGLIRGDESVESNRPLPVFEAILKQLAERPKADIGNLGLGRYIEVQATRLGL